MSTAIKAPAQLLPSACSMMLHLTLWTPTGALAPEAERFSLHQKKHNSEVCLFPAACVSHGCPLVVEKLAVVFLPLSLRRVFSYTEWLGTPEWDIHHSCILWQNLGACTDAAFADNDGCSHQLDWRGGLNYITFKLFFSRFQGWCSNDVRHMSGEKSHLRRENNKSSSIFFLITTSNWFTQ